MIAILLAGLSLGVLGSFHCIGMCGPIALALPVHQYSNMKKYLGIVLYNLGRAFTYSLLGFLFGFLGQTIFLGGFQQSLSIALGILILFFILFTYTGLNSFFKIKFVDAYIGSLKNRLGKLFQKKGLRFLLAIGLLNGLLPCGMVYLALAAAIASGGIANGALFMFSFGIGTLPVMLSLSLFGQVIQLKYRNRLRRVVPVFVSIMAVVLIMRGLNLGIPMLSPELRQETVVVNHEVKKKTVMKCCVHPKLDSLKTSSTKDFINTPKHNQ